MSEVISAIPTGVSVSIKKKINPKKRFKLGTPKGHSVKVLASLSLVKNTGNLLKLGITRDLTETNTLCTIYALC